MDDLNQQDTGPSPTDQPVDGLALWDAEALDNPRGGLTAIRIDQNERLLVPFTTSMDRTPLH